MTLAPFSYSATVQSYFDQPTLSGRLRPLQDESVLMGHSTDFKTLIFISVDSLGLIKRSSFLTQTSPEGIACAAWLSEHFQNMAGQPLSDAAAKIFFMGSTQIMDALGIPAERIHTTFSGLEALEDLKLKMNENLIFLGRPAQKPRSFGQ